jgi:adenosylcobyric acid synthase
MRSLMVQGVSSHAGKSLVVTGLCRWLRRRGVRGAPFKAQNMSNNARVVDGGEIGTAQYLQALAAGMAPDIRINPVLLKPQSHTSSQVVLDGVFDRELSDAPWRARSDRLWPHVVNAFESLRHEFDVVVIEGAGSPAETNLWQDDITNMRVAELAGAPVLLVADIDRGGAFAHLYGTWALLPPDWRARIEGFLLNKFRGDVRLLDPAPADLHAATGIPTVGILPWLDHHLPDEEGPTVRSGSGSDDGPVAVVPCGPYASNLDEFVALQHVARVRFVHGPADLLGADLVILPGSKHVAADLAWMRAQGLDERVTEAARSGVPILGICGGLQMLGGAIEDPVGVEGTARGLDLLEVTTTYRGAKRTARTSARFGPLPEPWTWLAGRSIAGYEIRHGTTDAARSVTAALPDGLGYLNGNVLGVYLHGLLEDHDVLAAFTGRRPPALDTVFDQLADAIDCNLDRTWLNDRLFCDR